MATKDLPLTKRVDMKCVKVNVLKNKARILRRLCVHVTYPFWNENTLFSCVNVKELLARNIRDI